jgi:hypothetical protein
MIVVVIGMEGFAKKARFMKGVDSRRILRRR